METIILLGGEPVETRRLAAVLADEYRIVHCPHGDEAAAGAPRCTATAHPAVLPAPGLERDAVLRRLAGWRATVIVIAAEDSPRYVVEAIKSGASDYLSARCPLPDLKAALRRATTRSRSSAPSAGPFIGESEAIRKAAETLALYAASDFPVLITGESGTGKEVAARALSELSPRRSMPFVARNCAALPEALAESELFGCERGAFTDAVARPGAFELADSGVLFLDEIGEASLPLQTKLLRVLESGESWRLGSKSCSQVDVRLVSATARDLRAAAASRSFRADLLYRIETLVLELPPLRVRREDIPALAAHFALEASRGRTVPGQKALEKLYAHEWPGNVRELRNVVHRALVLARGAEEIHSDHIIF
jgi:DNA-binding NtrC family response regulator